MDQTTKLTMNIDDHGDHDLDLCDPSLEERLAYEGVEVQIISASGNTSKSAVVEDVIVKPLQKGFSPIKVEPKDTNEDDLPEYVEIDDDYDDIKWQNRKGTPEVDFDFTEIDDSGIGADSTNEKSVHAKSFDKEYGLNDLTTDSPDVEKQSSSLYKSSVSEADKVHTVKGEKDDSVLDEDDVDGANPDKIQQYSNDDNDDTMEHDQSLDEGSDEMGRQRWKSKREKHKPRLHPYPGHMIGRGKQSVKGRSKVKSSFKEKETKPQNDAVSRNMSDMKKQIDRFSKEGDSIHAQIDNVSRNIKAIENELTMICEMDSAKRLENLRQKDIDTYDAVIWLRRSKELFSGMMYEPIMLCVNMKDQRYRRCLENLISQKDMTTFFFEKCEDKNLFLEITSEQLKLKVNALTVPKLASDWLNQPRPIDDYSQYGFLCYLQDMFSCPEPVMQFLRMQYDVQNIPIGDDRTKDLVYTIAEKSPEIKCFFTLDNQYQIKKSQYSGHASTLCKRLNEPSLLIRSVDEQRKLQLQQDLETEIETKTKLEKDYRLSQQRSQELARSFEQQGKEKEESLVPQRHSGSPKMSDVLVTHIQEPPPPMDCEGCHSTRSHNSIVQCCDGHVVCTSCVEKEAKLVIIGTKKGSVSCSVPSCKSSIPQSELRKSLPSIVMDLLEESWQKETLEALANMKDGVQCPGCGYSGVLEASIKNFKCNKCHKTYCRLCETEWQLKKHDLCIKMTKKVSEVTGHTISIPAHWEIDTEREQEMGFSTADLDPMSVEYLDIAALFSKSIHSETFTVKKVYRIQNQRLWEKYSLCRTHMIQDMGELHINERRLFHGTNIDAIDSICKEGFDWRLCGQNGTVYGQGTYFAKESSYSIKYSSKQAGKWTPTSKQQGSNASTTPSFPPAYTQNLRFNVLTGQPPPQPGTPGSSNISMGQSGTQLGSFSYPKHRYMRYMVGQNSPVAPNGNTSSQGANTAGGSNVNFSLGGANSSNIQNMNFNMDPSRSPFVRCNYGNWNPFPSNRNSNFGGSYQSGGPGVSFNLGADNPSSNTNTNQTLGGINPPGNTGTNSGGGNPSSNSNSNQGFGVVNLPSGAKMNNGPPTSNVTDKSVSYHSNTTSSGGNASNLASFGTGGIDPGCFIFTGNPNQNLTSGTSNSESGPSTVISLATKRKTTIPKTIPFSSSPMTRIERMKILRKLQQKQQAELLKSQNLSSSSSNSSTIGSITGTNPGIASTVNANLASSSMSVSTTSSNLFVKHFPQSAGTGFGFGIMSSASDKDCFYMFVGRVLVGRKCLGKSRMRRPDKDDQGRMCHTAVDHMNHSHIFVVFDSGQCYPEYLIEITKASRVGR